MTHDHDESAYRNHIREHLYPVLRELEPVRALWEGGSAARGALDEYSDIDICMHAEDEAFARIWEVFEAALSKIAKVEQRWSPGKGLWPGMEQREYILEDAPPYFMLDVVLFPASQPIPILERERHGEPIVILDRDGEVIPCALDREAHEARMKRLRARVGGVEDLSQACEQGDRQRSRHRRARVLPRQPRAPPHDARRDIQAGHLRLREQVFARGAPRGRSAKARTTHVLQGLAFYRNARGDERVVSPAPRHIKNFITKQTSIRHIALLQRSAVSNYSF